MPSLVGSEMCIRDRYIGKTEDGILHAVFEKDGKIWYVTEEKGDKENLTEYLKKTL